MRQYQELKALHPDAILFFRLGDFYEMFGSDAQAAAPLLGLVLTARQEVPMCGIPYHNSRHYIAKLLKAGHKIAVADQMEAPSAAKKIVRRAVTRLITPGTVIEDELLEPTASNFLMALELDIVGWGAACVDVSTGEFWATQALNDKGSRKLLDLLARVGPSEVVAASVAAKSLGLDGKTGRLCLTIYETAAKAGEAPSWIHHPVWANHSLAAKAAAMAARYIAGTQFHLKEMLAPAFRESAGQLQLDETAIRTLELVSAASGNRQQCLWGLLDFCRTPMGSRKLKDWILHPSTDIPEIELRHHCVEDLFNQPHSRSELSRILDDFADIPRVISRLSTRQAGPRDLGALRQSLAALPRLEQWLSAAKFCSGLSTLAAHLKEASEGLEACGQALNQALAEELPARISDGGLIRPGFNAELDELRLLRSDSRGFLEKLEAGERQATGIAALKAGYNSVFGYYFEITKTHTHKVPARFTRKQTLTNAERYITPKLKELENKILSSEEKILRLEACLFEDLREQVLNYHDPVLRLAQSLSELDVFNALAQAAAVHDFVKPQVDLSHDLNVVDGRHPVLAAIRPAGSFVPNSLELNARDPQIIVLTGPNMSGTSTFLRPNALIALLAQIGSFVPARSAKIGIVDKILTRIGAQDALAQGDSTFMVEMKETSHILKSATARSLIILDEVGRGTSTFDGISIAWAVLEHLHSAYAPAGSRELRGPRV